MTAEHLAAFRHAVRCLVRTRTTAESLTYSPALDYLQAIRRVQAAFGIPFNSDGYRKRPGDDAVWVRLHAAIFRWAEVVTP